MVKKTDIVSVPFKKEWLVESLDYALISWTSTFNRMGKPNPYLRIQKILIGLIAEKAFEDYLNHHGISYETNGKTKWYESDRYDIGINNYAVDVKSSFLDLNSSHINKKFQNFQDKYEWFTRCHALVPIDQFNAGSSKRRTHKRDKVYLFPFVEGNFDFENVSFPLIHAFWDYRWIKRAEFKNLKDLGHLKIKYYGNSESSIVIYGTSAEKAKCVEKLSLSKFLDVRTKNNFFQIFSILLEGEPPNGQLSIQSTEIDLTETIFPNTKFELEKTDNGYFPRQNNWQCLNLFNPEIHLLGWIYEEDLRVEGSEFKRFSKSIEQYSEIKVDNWGCFINELMPIKNLNSISDE